MKKSITAIMFALFTISCGGNNTDVPTNVEEVEQTDAGTKEDTQNCIPCNGCDPSPLICDSGVDSFIKNDAASETENDAETKETSSADAKNEQLCVPFTKRCDGQKVQACNGYGDAWYTKAECDAETEKCDAEAYACVKIRCKTDNDCEWLRLLILEGGQCSNVDVTPNETVKCEATYETSLGVKIGCCTIALNKCHDVNGGDVCDTIKGTKNEQNNTCCVAQ